MKIKELLEKFEIFMSNEEKTLLDKISYDYIKIDAFEEREKFIIENLVRKSLIQKIKKENDYYYRKNTK